jgi:hypothetical protein
MVEDNSEVVSKQTLSEALRHAESNDLAAMRSVIEADADAAEVAQVTPIWRKRSTVSART